MHTTGRNTIAHRCPVVQDVEWRDATSYERICYGIVRRKVVRAARSCNLKALERSG